MSTTFHPQTNGQTKRMNQTLEQYFRLFTGENKHKWVELLPTAQMAINESYNENLKQSPHEALYGTILKTIEIGPTINQAASTFAVKMKNSWETIGIKITKARQKIKKKNCTQKKLCYNQTRGQNIFINKKLDKRQIGHIIHWSIQNIECKKHDG